MPRKKTETSAAKAEPKPKAAKSSLDVFIETRLAGIAQVARTRGVDQTVDLGDRVVVVCQDGTYKVK